MASNFDQAIEIYNVVRALYEQLKNAGKHSHTPNIFGLWLYRWGASCGCQSSLSSLLWLAKAPLNSGDLIQWGQADLSVSCGGGPPRHLQALDEQLKQGFKWTLYFCQCTRRF